MVADLGGGFFTEPRRPTAGGQGDGHSGAPSASGTPPASGGPDVPPWVDTSARPLLPDEHGHEQPGRFPPPDPNQLLPSPHQLNPQVPTPAQAFARTDDDGPPFLGILALVLVVTGLLVTLLGGNQGGLLGMPLVVAGMGTGAAAAGRGYGRNLGLAAVFLTLGAVGLAVIATFLGF